MTIRIHRDRAAPMRHDVHVGRHVFSTDASEAEGGEGAGASPHDLYDAALGACKALTVLWYANRKGIPLEDVRVEVDRDASQERQGLYRLRVSLELTGPMSEAQRADLLRAAGKCPVHKLMAEVKTEIETVLA